MATCTNTTRSASARVNGAVHTNLEIQNQAVMAGLYRDLLPEGVVEANGLPPDHPATRGLSEEDKGMVELATERMKRVINNTPSITVERGIREFRDGQWEVNGDNIEDEFREVERRTFSDGVHWGRVIAFLAFSVSFAAYVSSRGISGGAGSVFAWTNQVLSTTLLDFMQRENGWRGFIQYSETLLRAQERRQRQSNEQVDHTSPGVWDSLATYAGIGALGVGALLVLGARQAFS